MSGKCHKSCMYNYKIQYKQGSRIFITDYQTLIEKLQSHEQYDMNMDEIIYWLRDDVKVNISDIIICGKALLGFTPGYMTELHWYIQGVTSEFINTNINGTFNLSA